jgi:hypothetical protein
VEEVAESYRPQVGTILEELAEGLAPFVDKQMSAHFTGDDWIVTAATRMGKREPVLATATDPQFQLEVMIRWWGPVFAKTLAPETRDTITELRTARNEWAHIVDDRPIDFAYATNVAQLAEELLREVGSPVASDVARIGRSLRLQSARQLADEQGVSEAEVLVKQLYELQRQRADLTDQLEDARRAAASASGHTRAVARQLADLQSQYAAVAGLRDQYLELQQQLEQAGTGAAATQAEADAVEAQLREARVALTGLQDDSSRLADELAHARQALADPVRTEVGRRWILLVAALVLVLGVVILLAYAVGLARG